MRIRYRHLLVGLLASSSLLACGSGESHAPSASAATPGAPASSASATTAASAAPAKPAGTKTTGQVGQRPGKKGKVGFSIELPADLKDVSDTDAVKQYRRGPNDFDGYGVTVMDANERWVAAGLDKTIEELSKDPDFTKNEAKIVDKGKTSDGWYWSNSIVEGGKKKAVNVFVIITKGDVSLTCRGSAEGALAEAPEKAVADLLAICETLVITPS